MIQFLNPLVLVGLAAAAIPFIIHFFNRFRAERREFSSLMLLREATKRNVRRLRMQRWLLLILRTLAVVLLVLAPARPVVRGMFAAGPREHLATDAVFVFDNSASLGYVDGSGAAWDFLVGRLARLRGWLAPSDRFRLITASNRVELHGDGWSSPESDTTDFAGELAPGGRGTNLGPALETAARILTAEREAVNREVYIFSDCQRGFLGPDSLALAGGRRIRWYVLGAHAGPPENLAVTALSLPGEIVRPGAPLKVSVEVAHFGGSESVKAMPRIYLDGRLVGQGETSVAPESRATVSVELPPLEAGSYELSVVLDADNLVLDNSRSILLRVPPRLKVCLIETPGASSPYLTAALEVLGREGVGAIELGERTELPARSDEFAGADVFILHGLDYPEARLQAFLDRALNLGASVLVLPHAAAASPADEAAQRFGSVAARLGIPLTVGRSQRFPAGAFDIPAAPGVSEAAGAVFGRLFAALPGLDKVKLNYLRELDPLSGDAGTGNASSRAWDLRTSGGLSLLRLVRGEGYSLGFCTVDLADPAETELARTPLFVPLVHALLALTADRGPVVRPDLTVGQTASILFGAPVATDRMEVHGPGESRFLLPPGERARVDFERTERPGVYRIYDGERLIGAFSVGVDPAESDIRLEEEATIRAKFNGQPLEMVSPTDTLEARVFLDRGGVEVWPGLLTLLLVVLGVEQVVANRGEKERK